MPAAPRLSAVQWAQVRKVWEDDLRPGYTWLVTELELGVSVSAVRKKAGLEGWAKASKSNQDKDLEVKEAKKVKRAETRAKRPLSTAAQSQSEKGERKSLRGKQAGGAAKKAPPVSAKRAPKKKAEGARRDGVSKPSTPEGVSDDATETFDDEDGTFSEAQTTEIDIVRSQFGRPPEYNQEYAKQAYKLCLLGATDEDIASFFEVSVRTIHYWKKQYPEFLHALKSGKKLADAEIAASMYQRARGMSIPYTHVSAYKGEIQLTELIEYLPPDVSAGKFWLTNRQPELWRADPQPAPPSSETMYPSDAELEDLYGQSVDESTAKKNAHRLERERLGLFDGSDSIPVDTDFDVIEANAKVRKDDQDDEVEGGPEDDGMPSRGLDARTFKKKKGQG